MVNKKTGHIVIILISMSAALVVFSLEPIAQDISYHNFKDQRTFFEIPNFWNVVSNIPFLLVGITGIYHLFYSQKIKFITDLKIAYVLLFISVSVVAVGSSYYHLWPANSTLFWDRLPMTVAFMSLFSIIIGEFISIKLGKILLWPLIVFGAYSVFYWHITESDGAGDLRLYILVQFLPVLLIPLILLFFKPVFTNISGYWLLLLAYIVAKLLEHFDSQVYDALLFMSGHSIKHIIAALGLYLLLISYNNRERI